MSYLLRHGAIKEQVPIDNNGKMQIKDLICWLNKYGRRNATVEDVMNVIKEDTKSRYSYDSDKDVIWATQGHSMNLDTESNMVAWTQDTQLIHGSYTENYNSILEGGLKPMSRQHVHMINPIQGDAWKLIRSNITMIVVVDPVKARKHGVKFLQAENGVILSGPIPSECLICINVPRKTGCYGFICTSLDGGEVLTVTTPAGHTGFPKGKRHKGEHSMCTALRELYEETSLTLKDITITEQTREEFNDRGNCPTVYYTATTQSKLPVKCLDQDEALTVSWSVVVPRQTYPVQ